MKKQGHGNAFVLIVGLAAWLHSSWAFANIIGGASPADSIEWFFKGIVNALNFLYWFGPAAGAAASIDVGMIMLAGQFREGKGSKAKLITFAVLSVISYTGQLLFSLSHSSPFHPSPGLSPVSVSIAGFVWEVFVWILPGALPGVLVLWAWGDVQQPEPIPPAPPLPPQEVVEEVSIVVVEPAKPAPVVVKEPVPELGDGVTGITAHCTACGWTKAYSSADIAYRGYKIHKDTCIRVSLPIKKEENVGR